MKKFIGLILMLAMGITLLIPAARILIAEDVVPASLSSMQSGDDTGSDFFKDPEVYFSPVNNDLEPVAFSYDLETGEDFFTLPSGFVSQLRRPPRV